MKLSVACLLAILAVVMMMHVDDTDGLFSRRRRWIRIRLPSCKWYCGLSGSGISCGVHCSWRRKRQALEPFPAHFESYDHDRSGNVTIEEFATTLKVKATERGTKIAFLAADRNGDGLMDEDEFDTAPFIKYDPDTDEEYIGGLDDTGSDDQNEDEVGENPDDMDDPAGDDDAGPDDEERGDQA